MINSRYVLFWTRIAAAALAVAVTYQPVPPPPVESEPSASLQVPEQVAHIEGDWRLVRMDGPAVETRSPDGETPAEVRLIVGYLTMRANSKCIGFAWRYQKEGDRVTLAPDNPGPMCARPLTLRERDFDRVMTGITDARIINGGMRHNGPAGELEFASNPSAAIVDLTGEWELARLDNDRVPSGREPPPAIHISITTDTIRAQSQCVAFWWRYRQSGLQVETRPDDPGPVCERTRTEWEESFARIVDTINIAQPIDADRIVLAGAGGQAELRRRPR